MNFVLSHFLSLGLLSYPQTTGLMAIAAGLGVMGFLVLPKLVRSIIEALASAQVRNLYESYFEPYFSLLRILFGLVIADSLLLLMPPIRVILSLELTIGLGIGILMSYLGTQVINKLFIKNIEKSIDASRKLDIEFFLVSKTLAIFSLIFVVFAIFAGIHDINIFAVLASLGVGGVAIAFAAQKVLEQFIGGVVLYFDSPFSIDDYIKLPDGTFGRVESIGLRLTKIRTSGKGTLVSVPNNLLVEENIENFTNAGKMMAIVNMNFPQGIDIEEQALVRQVLIAGFKDVAGIDPNSTTVSFSPLDAPDAFQGQVSFCVFSSSNKLSVDLRREVIRAAASKIEQKLRNFDIHYEIEPSPSSVSLPISI